MLFNSAEFLFLFLPFCLLLHFFLKSRVQKALALLLLSAWFYMAAFPVYIFLLLGLIALDYGGVILMDRCKGLLRKFWLWICLGSNIALLASFKYWNFIAENCNLLGADLPLHSWILPVGLSFHTFQSMSYVLEVYRKAWPAERNLLRYALYILFFPQMVAGPVERPQNILPQLHQFPPFNRADLMEGLFMLARGLFMKAAVADRLALYVNPAFEHSARISATQAMLAMLFFSFQIYADFSGYSNMALGTARMLGVRLMVNFRQPYLAGSLTDFWRRWHISLSTWFRDYLYIPLGGNRKGIFRSSFNLLLVFLVSGLWHGAGWNFLLWGLLHGIGLIAENYFFSDKQASFSWLRWLITQAWVLLCWVFFRAVSMENARQMFAAVLRLRESTYTIEFADQEIIAALLLCLALPLAEYYRVQEKAFSKQPLASIVLIFTAAYFFGNFNAGSFLYFQF